MKYVKRQKCLRLDFPRQLRKYLNTGHQLQGDTLILHGKNHLNCKFSFCFYSKNSIFVCRVFCDYGQVCTYLGANCVYIVFIATSFSKVINHELKVDWDIRLYVAAVVVPCIILGEIRQLKYLVPFSAIANLCILITFAITLFYMLTGPLPIHERPLYSSWGQLPLFFRYFHILPVKSISGDR